jgi:hypothetical protein
MIAKWMNRGILEIELLYSFFLFSILIMQSFAIKEILNFTWTLIYFFYIVIFILAEMLNFVIYVIYKESEGLRADPKVTGNPWADKNIN